MGPLATDGNIIPQPFEWPADIRHIHDMLWHGYPKLDSLLLAANRAADANQALVYKMPNHHAANKEHGNDRQRPAINADVPGSHLNGPVTSPLRRG